MGLLKWLQKKGSTGSIVRWVVKHYKLMQSKRPDLNNNGILELIFNTRFNAVSPKSSELFRYEEIKNSSDRFNSLYGLCMGIIYIEMSVGPLDNKLYKTTQEVVDEELKRLL